MNISRPSSEVAEFLRDEFFGDRSIYGLGGHENYNILSNPNIIPSKDTDIFTKNVHGHDVIMTYERDKYIRFECILWNGVYLINHNIGQTDSWKCALSFFTGY